MSIKVNHKEQLKEYNKPLDTIKKDICCAMCEKVIIRTVQIKDIPDQKKYKFTCPDCGGKSFITEFLYKMFIEPVNSKIHDIKEENGVWVVQLKKRGPLNDTEKIFIAEHFLKDSVKEISEKLKRTETTVLNYVAKLQHKSKEDIEKQAQEKQVVVEKQEPKVNRVALDTKSVATQMTQEGSSLPTRTKRYKSPFKT